MEQTEGMVRTRETRPGTDGQCLDTGSELPPASARPISLALLHILQSLPEPLIPRDKLDACAGANDRDEAFGCLEGMPGVDTNVGVANSRVPSNLAVECFQALLSEAFRTCVRLSRCCPSRRLAEG